MRFALIFFTLLSSFSSFSGKFVMCDQPTRGTNTIAHRLPGTWALDRTLSDNLGGQDYKLTKVRFTTDPSTLLHFPEFNKPENICVYLAGTMDLYNDDKEYAGIPFALTSIDGMPYIHWLESYGSEDIDGESFQVGIFTGSDPSRDILGLGGDFYSPDTAMILLKRENE